MILRTTRGGTALKLLAINGSPRKTWNTATLLEESMKGAASQGAATELIHIYDLTYQFDDYSKVFAPRWDPEKKAKRRAEVFPEDCRRAFEMGKRLASIG